MSRSPCRRAASAALWRFQSVISRRIYKTLCSLNGFLFWALALCIFGGRGRESRDWYVRWLRHSLLAGQSVVHVYFWRHPLKVVCACHRSVQSWGVGPSVRRAIPGELCSPRRPRPHILLCIQWMYVTAPGGHRDGGRPVHSAVISYYFMPIRFSWISNIQGW